MHLSTTLIPIPLLPLHLPQPVIQTVITGTAPVPRGQRLIVLEGIGITDVKEGCTTNEVS
jgi:hypothetical protein